MSMRSDIETATALSNAKMAKKKAKRQAPLYTAGMMGDLFDKLTGKKRKRKIDDILSQDPTRPQPQPDSDDSDDQENS